MVENVIRVLEPVFTLVVRQRPLVAVRIITASKEEVMSCLKMTLLYRMTERLPVTWPVPAEKFPLSNKKVFVFFLQENNHQKETDKVSLCCAFFRVHYFSLSFHLSKNNKQRKHFFPGEVRSFNKVSVSPPSSFHLLSSQLPSPSLSTFFLPCLLALFSSCTRFKQTVVAIVVLFLFPRDEQSGQLSSSYRWGLAPQQHHR